MPATQRVTCENPGSANAVQAVPCGRSSRRPRQRPRCTLQPTSRPTTRLTARTRCFRFLRNSPFSGPTRPADAFPARAWVFGHLAVFVALNSLVSPQESANPRPGAVSGDFPRAVRHAVTGNHAARQAARRAVKTGRKTARESRENTVTGSSHVSAGHRVFNPEQG